MSAPPEGAGRRRSRGDAARRQVRLPHPAPGHLRRLSAGARPSPRRPRKRRRRSLTTPRRRFLVRQSSNYQINAPRGRSCPAHWKARLRSSPAAPRHRRRHRAPAGAETAPRSRSTIRRRSTGRGGGRADHQEDGGEAVLAPRRCQRANGPAKIAAAARDAFGRIDILVNNAGVLDVATLPAMRPGAFPRKSSAVNVFGVAAMTRRRRRPTCLTAGPRDQHLVDRRARG